MRWWHSPVLAALRYVGWLGWWLMLVVFPDFFFVRHAGAAMTAGVVLVGVELVLYWRRRRSEGLGP